MLVGIVNVRYVFLLSLLIILLFVLLCGCSFETNNQHISKTVSEIRIPSAIKGAALPTGATLVASVYMDGNTTATATKSLTLPVTSNVEVTLTNISVGNHTFTIVFEYTNDPDPNFAGTFELARATSGTVSIVQGQNPDLVFQDTDFDTSSDSDGDGVSNVAELDQNMRTNPSDSTCVLGKSILQNTAQKGCTLG
jgi:hypothetical protein